jgi:hypothetical protein
MTLLKNPLTPLPPAPGKQIACRANPNKDTLLKMLWYVPEYIIYIKRGSLR